MGRRRKKVPKVVVLGGGTGTYAVLSGLKRYPLDITAVVSMADSGGSARKERDEWGMLPVSDARKALLALAKEDAGPSTDSTSSLQASSGLLRELLNYRFSEGVGVEGTSFGNLFLVALSNILGSQEKAIEELGQILKIKGQVLPVALEQTNLVAEYEKGVTIVGEHEIDEPKHDGRLQIRRIYLLPSVKVYPPALAAIRKADLIIIGPGDLFTSLIPALIVEGVSKALRQSRAQKVFILNLMNRYGQTYGFSASKFLSTLDGYLRAPVFDYVFVSDVSLPKAVLRHYARREQSYPVEDDLGDGDGFKVVRGDFLSRRVVKPQPGDKLRRSLLRHDPKKLAKAITKIISATGWLDRSELSS